jgi:hypothetical protein
MMTSSVVRHDELPVARAVETRPRDCVSECGTRASTPPTRLVPRIAQPGQIVVAHRQRESVAFDLDAPVASERNRHVDDGLVFNHAS